jgi:hypothetical protein
MDEGADEEWVNIEHTEFSKDNKESMALLLILAER